MDDMEMEVLTWLNGYLEGIIDRKVINQEEVITLIQRLEVKLEELEPYELGELSEEELDNLPF